MIQMLPMLQGINPSPQVMLTVLDYSPLPASLVAKIKTAVQQAAQNAPPPPPDPMTLMIQEKQADVEANKQRHMQTLVARKAEKDQDLAHQRALANLDYQKVLEAERVKLAGKREEMLLDAEQKHREHLQALEQKRLDHTHKQEQHAMNMTLLAAKEREATNRIEANGKGE